MAQNSTSMVMLSQQRSLGSFVTPNKRDRATAAKQLKTENERSYMLISRNELISNLVSEDVST